MFITSYGFPLHRPSGSLIVEGVLSHFTGNIPQMGGGILVNGNPMLPNFLRWKGKQYGCSLFPLAE